MKITHSYKKSYPRVPTSGLTSKLINASKSNSVNHLQAVAVSVPNSPPFRGEFGAGRQRVIDAAPGWLPVPTRPDRDTNEQGANS